MGPYIQVATFCEEVDRDPTTNNLSVQRFVTEANMVLVGGPRKMPPLPLTPFPLVVTIWAGGIVGRHRVRIVPEDPHGNKLEPVHDGEADFADTPLAGLDLVLRLPMLVTEEGLYFFYVIVSTLDSSSEWTIARIPLQVHYHRSDTAPS